MTLEKIIIQLQNLRFTALASGPPEGELVLLLHGFPQFADAWREVMGPIGDAGFRTVAVDQRGYSSGARPQTIADYALDHLLGDAHGFADALRAGRFHLAGHDWGGFLAWYFASRHPDRLLSLTAISAPHPDSWRQAMHGDDDQKRRSQYIGLFREPGGVAERLLEADDYSRLRGAYQRKVTESAIEANISRFRENGGLTAALNWYRAFENAAEVGKIKVPTLHMWGSEDRALGKTAAVGTAEYMAAPYRCQWFEGRSHWLLDEIPSQVADLILDHLRVSKTEQSVC